MIQVFGHTVENGQKAYFSVPVGELCHRAMEQFPVIVVAGRQEGPTLWVNGTVHGDELNGSYAAWELSRELDPETMTGNLVVTPVCNPNAFYARKKLSELDYLDMDTSFPGNPEGMLTQRIAAKLYAQIKSTASALISFHTMATPYIANPYSVRKIVPGVSTSVNETAEGMQKAFGVITNCVVNLCGKTNELPGVTNGALDITCMTDGIPAFMGEMGQGGKLDDAVIAVGKRGIANVMRYLGILPGEVEETTGQIKITNRKFLYSNRGGMMRMMAKPGEVVKKGESLLQVHYYDDRLEDYTVAQDCYIIGARENPVVNEGDRVAFVGLEWTAW